MAARRFPHQSLPESIAEVFVAAACGPHAASVMADHLIQANWTGHDSHGVIRTVQCKSEGKPVDCFGFSTVSSERHQSTHSRSPRLSEIAIRLAKHVFRAENSDVFWEWSRSDRRAVKSRPEARQEPNVLRDHAGLD